MIKKNTLTIIFLIWKTLLHGQVPVVESFLFNKPEGLNKEFTAKCIWVGEDEIAYTIKDLDHTFLCIYDVNNFAIQDEIQVFKYQLDYLKFIYIDENIVRLVSEEFNDSNLIALYSYDFDRSLKTWNSKQEMGIAFTPKGFSKLISTDIIFTCDFKLDSTESINSIHVKLHELNGEQLINKNFTFPISSVKSYDITAEVFTLDNIWLLLRMDDPTYHYSIFHLDLNSGEIKEIKLDLKGQLIFKCNSVVNDSIVEFTGLLSNSKSGLYGWDGIFRQRINYKRNVTDNLVFKKFEKAFVRQLLEENKHSRAKIKKIKEEDLGFNDFKLKEIYLAPNGTTQLYINHYAHSTYYIGTDKETDYIKVNEEQNFFSYSILNISISENGLIQVDDINKRHRFKFYGRLVNETPYNNQAGETCLKEDTNMIYFYNESDSYFDFWTTQTEMILGQKRIIKEEPNMVYVKKDSTGSFTEYNIEISSDKRVWIYPESFINHNLNKSFGFGEYKNGEKVFVKISL